MAEIMSNVKAIKLFFESGENGRRFTMEEMKALTIEDRVELGAACAKALGSEIGAAV